MTSYFMPTCTECGKTTLYLRFPRQDDLSSPRNLVCRGCWEESFDDGENDWGNLPNVFSEASCSELTLLHFYLGTEIQDRKNRSR